MKKNHFYFLISQFLNICGDQIFLVGLGLITWVNTGSTFDVGIIYGSTYSGSLVAFLIMPVIKQFNLKVLMQVSNLLSAVLIMLFLFIEIKEFRLLTVFLYGLARAINKPIVQSFIVHLSSDLKTLKTINSDYQIIMIIAYGIGVISLGLTSAFLNVSMIFYLSVLCLLTCSIFMIFIHSLKKNDKLQEESYKKVLWQAVKFIQKSKTGFSITVLSSCVFAICLAFNNQLIPFTSVHGYTLKDYVIIQVSMILGLLFAGWYIRKERGLLSKITDTKLFALGWLVTGVCYMVLPTISFSFILCVLILTISAIFDGFSNVMQRIVLAELVPRNIMESIFAFRFLMRDIFKAFIAPVLGYCMQTFGMDISIFGLGLAAFLIMGYIFFFGISKPLIK